MGKEAVRMPDNPATVVAKAKVLEALMQGMSVAQAARYANVPEGTAGRWVRTDPWVISKLTKRADNSAYRAKASRADVEDILLEAVDIARMKAEPGDMIRGATELGKLHGYYAPQERKVTLEGDLSVHQMQELSDDDLYQLIGHEQSPIEAEFERISNDDE